MNIDEKALEIVKWFDNFVCEAPNTPPDVYAAELSKRIAAAILRARNEALEEAAKVADQTKQPYRDTDDEMNAMGTSGYNGACADIADAIRALKGE